MFLLLCNLWWVVPFGRGSCPAGRQELGPRFPAALVPQSALARLASPQIPLLKQYDETIQAGVRQTATSSNRPRGPNHDLPRPCRVEGPNRLLGRGSARQTTSFGSRTATCGGRLVEVSGKVGLNGRRGWLRLTLVEKRSRPEFPRLSLRAAECSMGLRPSKGQNRTTPTPYIFVRVIN